jgi:UDP-N-acetylmuramoyl-L-alanyl-D-glutamate--2,6-diaminopimelate ligase
VADSKKALLSVVENFYENPTQSLTVIGITGTNGKTTTTYLIHSILQYLGYNSGTIGTYGYSINNRSYKTNLTTPDIVQLYDIFYEMKQNKIQYVVMEVSSHAIALDRIARIKFNGAVMTNISRDHLDFHKTMENYAKTKSELFRMIPKSGFTITNIDAPYSPLFLKKSQAVTLTYSLESEADFTFSKNTSRINGINGKLIYREKVYDFHSLLSGKFNMQNLLAAVALCHQLNIPMVYILNALREILPPPGRLQEIPQLNAPRIFIDYAHTPDAITNALNSLKELLPENGRLVAVFGCGGNRDKTKRPLMSQAAESMADFSILTTDNPRNEDPSAIIKDAEKGFRDASNYKIIVDRQEAIEYALKNFTYDDIIAVLGKGHEDYQEIKGKREPFDDAKIVRDYFNENK